MFNVWIEWNSGNQREYKSFPVERIQFEIQDAHLVNQMIDDIK